MTTPSGKIISNCSNSCDLRCDTLTCAHKCIEPEVCVPGFICPYGTVENEYGECVPSSMCRCLYGGVYYSNGQYITDKNGCKIW